MTCQECLTGLLCQNRCQDLIFVVSTTLYPFSADCSLYHSMSFDLSFSLSLEAPKTSLFKEDQTARAESHHVDCPELATGTVAMTATQAQQCYYFRLYLLLYIGRLFLCLQKSFLPVIKIDKLSWHSCRIFPTII